MKQQKRDTIIVVCILISFPFIAYGMGHAVYYIIFDSCEYEGADIDGCNSMTNLTLVIFPIVLTLLGIMLYLPILKDIRKGIGFDDLKYED